MFKAEYFFVRILLPFLIGIFAFYNYANEQVYQILSWAVSITFCMLTLQNVFYKRYSLYRYKWIIGLTIFSFFFLFGGFLCVLNNEKTSQNYFGNQKYTALKILVNGEPQQTNDILRFKSKVISGYKTSNEIKLSGQLLIALKLDSLNPIHLKYGDELIVGANYLEVEPPYNPAEFNFKSWLACQNIYEQAFVNQNHVFKTNRNSGNPIIRFALNLRAQQIAKYRRLIKNDEAFAVASTLILGYRADLSKETLSAYSKTGTIHALSVSGAHVAIIYLVLDFLLLFLNRKRLLQVLKFILICALIWGYALITGLSPSVVRAAIMITIFMLAKTFSKNKNGYNVLAFSAFCQLLYDPFLIWNVGFQLSYIAVFGLIYLQPIIYHSVYVKNKWIDKLWNVTALSLAAQIVTFPLSIYYFHQFPLYFLLGNLFIMIPLTVMMYLGIIILIPFLEFLAPIFEWIINFTNSVLRWISDLPMSTFSAVWITIPQFILLSLALGFVIIALERRQKKLLFIAGGLFIVYQTLVVHESIKLAEQKKIIFYSLRKNYAVAFISGDKAIIETDLNPAENNYQFFVKPSLDQAQIKDIVYLNLKNDTTISNFIKKGNQIVFLNRSFLIVNENFNYKKLDANAKFNSLWLTGNTKFDLQNLDKNLKYENIIIDATNKDYKIKVFRAFAANNQKPYHILKKNAAYLVDLNP